SSSAYTKSSSFYTNQKYTIGDQLRLGVRYLELEVHWSTGSKKGTKELLLCGGAANNSGCKISDRTFRQGLEEIRDCISKPNNRNEVLLIYIKDHLDGHYSEVLNILKNSLGSWLY
ncbi:phospholipase, partial [Leptospira borgpetersenii serovar Hardjo-bovis]|nr:phospholipase [Leptospira borgpetersenii serovar Hardjo-bovis]